MDLFTYIYNKLLIKDNWCLRCDGLPDPTNLPLLHEYVNRWSDASLATEASINRLTSRLPELNQVICDVDQVLERPHDASPDRIRCLIDSRRSLAALVHHEIHAAIKSVISDVAPFLAPEETLLSVQVSFKSSGFIIRLNVALISG